jgi:hypothetical protein
VASSNGVRQGDVLASIAFAITVQPIFQACLQRKAKGFAIIDDFTITGPLHDVAASYMELDRINFKVNTKKTFIYMPEPNDIPADFAQWADKQQLEIKHHATSLGTIITRDNQKTAEFLAKKLDEIDQTCDLLCSEQVSAQVALLLKTRCLIPKLHFLAKTLPPSNALTNFANRFDNKMFSLFTGSSH